MAGGSDGADDFRPMVGEPPQHEEGALRVMSVEAFEQSVDALDNSAWTRKPVVPMNRRFQRPDLEVLFDVNCKEMCCHPEPVLKGRKSLVSRRAVSHFRCQFPALAPTPIRGYYLLTPQGESSFARLPVCHLNRPE